MREIKFTPIPKIKFSLELIGLLADWDQNKIPSEEVLVLKLAKHTVKNIVRMG